MRVRVPEAQALMLRRPRGRAAWTALSSPPFAGEHVVNLNLGYRFSLS